MARKFTETLVCNLTEDEVATRADAAARAQRELDDAQRDIDAAKKSAKTTIDTLDARRRLLLEEVRTRQGFRPVECEESPDYLEGLMRVVRLDTAEIVRSRPLTAEERQVPLMGSDQRPQA